MEDEDDQAFDHGGEGDDVGAKLRGGFGKLHISREAASKYGTSPGCPVPRRTERREHPPCRFGYKLD